MLGAVQLQAPCPQGPPVQTEEMEKRQGMPSPLLSTRGSAAQGSGINSNPIRVSGSISVCRNRSSVLALADFEVVDGKGTEHLRKQGLKYCSGVC